LVGTVQRSAIANDQLGLRDDAGSVGRMLLVMIVGDLFFQLTYGAGGGVGILGVIGSLLVAGYWIYCHLRLSRFLYNAAYFMNEPHDLPIATARLRSSEDAPKPPEAPAPRPSRPPVPRPSRPEVPRPSQPIVPTVNPIASPAPPVPVPPAAPAPARPASESGEQPAGDEPRFLR
jgi:hypothetical protein